MHSTTKSAGLALGAIFLAGCSTILPSMGPDRHQIQNSPNERILPAIQVVDVTDDLNRRLLAL